MAWRLGVLVAIAAAEIVTISPAMAQLEVPTTAPESSETLPSESETAETSAEPAVESLDDAAETSTAPEETSTTGSSSTEADSSEDDLSAEDAPSAEDDPQVPETSDAEDVPPEAATEREAADEVEPNADSAVEPEASTESDAGDRQPPARPGNAGQLGTPPREESAPDALTLTDVTNEQVTQLARSLLAIQPLLIQANEEIQNAESTGQRQSIEQNFEAKAIEVVEREGLTVDTYRQLLVLADRDREFKQRVSEQLDAIQQDSDSQ